MAEALAAHGLDLEAQLLAAYDGGRPHETVVDGRRAWVGRKLPKDPQAGDLFLDALELSPMILLPREFEYTNPADLEVARRQLGPFVAWLGLRPVERWQYGGFLDVAKFKPRKVQLKPPKPTLDRERILGGPEREPVTRLMPMEANLYPNWFGTGKATQPYWLAAQRALSEDEFDALWGPVREYGEEVDEGVTSVVDSLHLDVNRLWDDYDEDEELPDEETWFFGDYATPADVGFRTAISTQLDLGNGGGNDPLSFLDIALADGIRR
jgi:hypothetical protein